MITNIVFDFGGVLLDWNPRYFYRTYFHDEEEMEYFLANVCNNEWNARLDAGLPFAEGMREVQEKYPQYTEAIQMYWDKWEFMLKCELPESVQLLKRLKAQGYGIYGLTNWSAETIGYAYSGYDFFRLFDGIVVSGEEKVIKPSPRIYEILLQRYGLVPENTLFIDDNLANVEAARQLGIHAIQFDNINNVTTQVEALIGER